VETGDLLDSSSVPADGLERVSRSKKRALGLEVSLSYSLGRRAIWEGGGR